jgi:anti-anti-sigma factor
MKIKTTKNKISLEGDMIIENAEKGKEQLLAALDKIHTGKTVTIDLGKVNELDSSGFQLLLALIRSLENRDIQFKLKRVRKVVFDVIELAGLNKFFKIETTDLVA